MADREEGLQPRRRREPVLRQASPLEEIRLSCLKGNLQSVQRIIEAGITSVNEVFEDGWTSLMVASNGGHPQIVQFLLEQNGDPNIRRPDGFSSLMAALMSSQREEGRVEAVVELLVKNGADVNVHNKAGLCPLIIAIRDNKPTIVELLISNGANVNSKDKEGRTPLFHASDRGFEDICRVLLEYGADTSAIDHAERSALDVAVAKGHIECADIIRQSTLTENPSIENPEVEEIPEPSAPAFSEPINQRSSPEPVIQVYQAPIFNDASPIIPSNNLRKDSDCRMNAADKHVTRPAEKTKETGSMLAAGLAFGAGIGGILIYYAYLYTQAAK